MSQNAGITPRGAGPSWAATSLRVPSKVLTRGLLSPIQRSHLPAERFTVLDGINPLRVAWAAPTVIIPAPLVVAIAPRRLKDRTGAAAPTVGTTATVPLARTTVIVRSRMRLTLRVKATGPAIPTAPRLVDEAHHLIQMRPSPALAIHTEHRTAAPANQPRSPVVQDIPGPRRTRVVRR